MGEETRSSGAKKNLRSRPYAHSKESIPLGPYYPPLSPVPQKLCDASPQKSEAAIAWPIAASFCAFMTADISEVQCHFVYIHAAGGKKNRTGRGRVDI